MSTLTDGDLTLLDRPLHGFLTVAGNAQPRPIWYETTADREIQFFTLASSPKVPSLRRDPRASLVVAAPVGEFEHWVSVAGRVTLSDDGADDLSSRLAARYWGAGERVDDLAAMQAAGLIRVVLHPETVRRVAY